MQAKTTQSDHEYLTSLKNFRKIDTALQPQEATLRRILQFAASCKTIQLSETWKIDLFLN